MTRPVSGSRRYRAGADFERLVRADLMVDGYEVIRSAGSRSPVDLIGFKAGEILLVQCKRGGRIGPAERHALLRLAALVDAVPLVAEATGPPGARLTYRRLTGPGPGEWKGWTADRPDNPVDRGDTTTTEYENRGES